MHATLYEVSGESQFSHSVWWLYDFANLLCKTVKCHEGSFLKNKISFAEEVIGNIIKSWKPHIDFVSKKISKSVGIIAKARFYLSSQTLMTLYYSHVYPFLTYCNVAYLPFQRKLYLPFAKASSAAHNKTSLSSKNHPFI